MITRQIQTHKGWLKHRNKPLNHQMLNQYVKIVLGFNLYMISVYKCITLSTNYKLVCLYEEVSQLISTLYFVRK